MAGRCCDHDHSLHDRGAGWRRALWIALIVNASMFAVETVAGAAAGSRALQADALDFLGDSATYAISLAVARMALGWRSRAAVAKGALLVLSGIYVLLSTAYAVLGGARPHAEAMGAIGIAALLANLAVALMLFRFREGDANMRSVWICTRNDAIGNVAVLAAAAGVFGTGTPWPDLLVAFILSALAIWGGISIISQAYVELLGSDPGGER